MREPELIVAVDVPKFEDVRKLTDCLGEEARFLKVGLELFTACGWRVVDALREHGAGIFLDLKFHDIPRTVERAVSTLAGHGVRLFTIHAAGGRDMVKAAAQAAGAMGGGDRPRVVAVTTLTSLSAADLAGIGVREDPKEQALRLGALALEAGADGLVTSVLEAAALRSRFGPEPLLVTPGIRVSGGELGDQKRVATAAAAVEAGADFLVVGRPVVEASDPAAAARAFRAEMAAACGLRA